MTQSIMKDPLRFPDDVSERCSEAGIMALKGVSHFYTFLDYRTDYLQFIDRDPTTRLGCRPNGQGIEDIRRHPWFSCIEWDTIEKKESQPPFIPDKKQANFDVSHEIDEFLMVEKPLTHSKRKVNPNLEKMKPELRQLEEQFTVYNYTNMQRMTYYPHNQPVTALGTDSNDTERTYTVTGTILPTTTIFECSQAGTPMLESTSCHNPPPISKGYVAS
jgi:serine/threonine kinase 32